MITFFYLFVFFTSFLLLVIFFLFRKKIYLEKKLFELNILYSSSTQKINQLELNIESERNFFQTQIDNVNNSKEILSNQFKVLAQEILEEKNKNFSDFSTNQLNSILLPFQIGLSDFKNQIHQFYDNESKDRFALKSEILRLADLNSKMSCEAQALTNALRGNSKIQGDWGELVLESILESSGLRRDHEFMVQKSQINSSGNLVQPDIIINLPEGRNLIIDSKVSITAYAKHVESNDFDESQRELHEHLRSIENHIQSLSTKDYSGILNINSLDFVLMFIPIEPAFLSAIKHSPHLYQDALNKNIILVCPSTLMVTLRTVAHFWRQDYQNRNAKEIARQCAALYDKFVNFVDDLELIGKRLDQAQSSYHEAFNKLKSGKGNLVNSVEKVKELGIKPNKSIPKNFLNPED